MKQKGAGILMSLLALLFVFAAYLNVKSYIPDCSKNSDAVTYARSLSQARLTKLYFDMQSFYEKNNKKYIAFAKDSMYEIPEEFSDIEAIEIKPNDGRIKLKGCLDNYVYLEFEGYNHLKEFFPNKLIRLSWGELPPNSGNELLWQE